MTAKTFVAAMCCLIGILLFVAVGVDILNSTGKTEWTNIALAFSVLGFSIHFFVPASNPA